MKSHFDYENKVYKFLMNAPAGSVYTIDNICKPETKQLFIDTVKMYMRETEYAGGFEFNADYSKLKKIKI